MWHCVVSVGKRIAAVTYTRDWLWFVWRKRQSTSRIKIIWAISFVVNRINAICLSPSSVYDCQNSNGKCVADLFRFDELSKSTEFEDLLRWHCHGVFMNFHSYLAIGRFILSRHRSVCQIHTANACHSSLNHLNYSLFNETNRHSKWIELASESEQKIYYPLNHRSFCWDLITVIAWNVSSSWTDSSLRFWLSFWYATAVDAHDNRDNFIWRKPI